MKRLLALSLLLLLIITACDPIEEPTVEEEEEEEGSICDTYQTDYIAQKCYATEALDMEMCRDITHSAHKEDCVILVAELGGVGDCSIAAAEANQVMCEALINDDIDICLTMEQDFGNSLTARDCITLVARKMQDSSLCQYYETHANSLFQICGDTQDCEGQFLEPLMIQENIDSCKSSIAV